MTSRKWSRLQSVVLRLVGTVEMLAFGAVLMPREWMETIHGQMGLHEMPQGPVFDAVMREVSFSYGLHGIALWLIALDVQRYRPLVVLTAIGYLAAGPVFFAIDILHRMPWIWIAGNGGSCLLVGTVLLALLALESAAGRRRTDVV
jgi:hypothetical protein